MAKDAGRNGDERADDRRDPAQEHRLVLPTGRTSARRARTARARGGTTCRGARRAGGRRSRRSPSRRASRACSRSSPLTTMTVNDCQPLGTSRPKTTTCWPTNAPAASAPAYTITSSLAAGSTASTNISTKTAYTPWSPMNDVRASVIDEVMEARSTGRRDYFRRTAHGELRRQRDGACRVLRRHARNVRPRMDGGALVRAAVPRDRRRTRLQRHRRRPPSGRPFPTSVSIRDVTDAARASSNCATTRRLPAAAPTAPAAPPCRSRASC